MSVWNSVPRPARACVRHWKLRLWGADSLRHFVALIRGTVREVVVLRILKLRLNWSGRRLVIITPGGLIGDMIACEPVARFIRAQEPTAFIIWMTRRPLWDLVRHHPDIDAIRPLECMTHWDYIRHFGVCDRAIDLNMALNPCTACRAVHRKIGGDDSITYRNYHDHGGLLPAFAKSAGLPPLELDAQPRMYIDAGTRTRVDQLGLPPRFVVVHCTPSTMERRWTTSAWAEFARRVTTEYGVAVIEIGLAPVIRLDSPSYIDRTGQLGLLESAEVIRRSQLFVGVDSGPAHMANAVGTPGIILLGRIGKYRTYTPFTGRFADPETQSIIRTDGFVASISVDSVLERVRRKIPNAAPASTQT